MFSIRRSLTATISILIFSATEAQQADSTLTGFSQYFTPEKKYLALPVKNGAPKRNVELWVDGVMERYFDIELADGNPDWLSYLNIDDWKGKPVELRIDKIPKDSKAFNPIAQSDSDRNHGQLYHERLRAQIHFSPKRGWTNDPNGLVFFNGEYHLFFQHNPYGREWGNMTWGHAMSKDMIHWTETDDALHPDAGGTVFSGCAVVDEKNTSGLGKDGKIPMIVFHTGAKAWGQFISWSYDGTTFQSMGNAVVPRINKDNRDPKVIWYEPTKKWIMVLYVERDSGYHSMQFLSSPDLQHWTALSSIKGGKGADLYLFECPEFYELPIEGNPSEKKWILTGANSQYAIGSFDGTTFTPEAERLNGQLGRGFYAAQTISNQPGGRRIEIGWWRTQTALDSMSFNQSQSIPLEHHLVRTADGLRLTRLPVKELTTLRDKKFTVKKLTVSATPGNQLKNISVGSAEIRFTLQPGKAKEITMNIKGVPVTYNVANQELIVDSVKAKMPLQAGKLDLIIYADRIGLEIFASNGLVFMPVNINIDDTNRSVSVVSKEGKATITNLEVYDLKSIWP